MIHNGTEGSGRRGYIAPRHPAASIISIEGDSYRRRVAEEPRAERKAKKS